MCSRRLGGHLPITEPKLVTGAASRAIESCCGHRLVDMALDVNGLYERLDRLDGELDGKVGGEHGLSVAVLPLNAEAGLELVLAAGAIASQVSASRPIPLLARAVMAPLLAFEAYLKALAVGKALPR